MPNKIGWRIDTRIPFLPGILSPPRPRAGSVDGEVAEEPATQARPLRTVILIYFAIAVVQWNMDYYSNSSYRHWSLRGHGFQAQAQK